jgi:hypothetical protein
MIAPEEQVLLASSLLNQVVPKLGNPNDYPEALNF